MGLRSSAGQSTGFLNRIGRRAGKPRGGSAQSRGKRRAARGLTPIPSQARPLGREGVETRRAAPKGASRILGAYGEGIVQTTNASRRRRKPKWYETWGRRFEPCRGRHALSSSRPSLRHPIETGCSLGPVAPPTGANGPWIRIPSGPGRSRPAAAPLLWNTGTPRHASAAIETCSCPGGRPRRIGASLSAAADRRRRPVRPLPEPARQRHVSRTAADSPIHHDRAPAEVLTLRRAFCRLRPSPGSAIRACLSRLPPPATAYTGFGLISLSADFRLPEAWQLRAKGSEKRQRTLIF